MKAKSIARGIDIMLSLLRRNRYWFFAVCAAVPMFAVDWATSPPTTIKTWASALLYIVLLIMLPLFPVPASLLQVLLFSMTCLLVGDEGPSQSIGTLLAMAVIGRCCALWVSIIAIALSSGILLISTFLSPGTLAGTGSIGGLMSYSATFAGAILIGRALLWRDGANARDKAEQQYAALKRNIVTAAQIHDSMSEKVARLILLAQMQELNGSSEQAEVWYIVRDTLQDVLRNMHRVIDGLERPTSSGAEESATLVMAAVEKIVNICRDRLEQDGYTGEIAFTGVCNARLRDMPIDIIGLLQELFANISRHCDSFSGPYKMSIVYDDDSVTIQQSNSADRSTGWMEPPQSGHGLRLYDKLLSAAGGRMITESRGGQWSIVVVVPVN